MNAEAADLAREVLALAHEDETVTVCTIPDSKAAALARAVARVDALAELLERESGILRDRGDHPNESGMMAARIRIALNGGSHE